MTVKYMIAENDEGGSITAAFNGSLFVAERTHAAWPQIVEAVKAAATQDNPDLVALERLFDPSLAVADFFTKVSERVSVSNGHVFFDGEEMNGGLADHIIRFMNEGNDATPLINFMENIMTNPNEHSRTQLFDWLSKRDFTITPEGNFLAYKGVRPRSGDSEYPYESISRGQAVVDGKPYSGAIPNGVGAVVEMPRGAVAHDPDVACHTGLHAGNFRYANSFAQGALLVVEINPRDVVSVPHDSNSEKIRTCRYTVKEVRDQEITDSFYGGYSDLDIDFEDEDEWDAYEDDYDEYGNPIY